MAGTLAPSPVFTGWDSNGDPLASGKLHTYAAGTTTNLATYSDSALLTPNANPVILDSAGRAVLYLAASSYKFVLKTSADVTVWTQDNIGSVPATDVDLDVTGTAGEDLVAGNAVYLSAGDGSRTAGRWYKTDADLTYASSEAHSIGMMQAALLTGVSGTIRKAGRVTGLSALTAGTTYYISATAGAITATAPTNVRVVGQSDSTTSLILGEIPSWRVFARSTADLTKNANITPADITGLAFAVRANEVWSFQFHLKGISTAVADWRFGLTGPAAPTAVWFSTVQAALTGGGAAASFTEIFMGATGVEEGILLQGLLRNGATAGTVQLQMAQNTSEATNTIIRAESYVLAQRLS